MLDSIIGSSFITFGSTYLNLLFDSTFYESKIYTRYLSLKKRDVTYLINHFYVNLMLKYFIYNLLNKLYF